MIKFILMLLAGLFISCSLASAQESDAYATMRRAGIDYMIATMVIEEQKKYSCGYLFKKSTADSYGVAKKNVFVRLSQKDKASYLDEMPLIENQIRSEIKNTAENVLFQLNGKLSSESSCGVLLGFATDRYVLAKSKWSTFN